jgi:cyclopropane-fatty-acyl-phospholipid synthase
MSSCNPGTVAIPNNSAISSSPSWIDRSMRALAIRSLKKIKHGQIILRDSIECLALGDPGPDHLKCTLTVHSLSLYRTLVTSGSLGAAEAYMEGDWSCDDLTTLVRIFSRNQTQMEEMDGGLARIAGWLARAGHGFSRNTQAGSRRNIAAHYDLSNSLFQLFLDPTMMYSSALFEEPSQSLESASIAKLDRICRALDLQPTDHLVEIGTGWGGMALHAARNYGCRVTTTTISKEQHALAGKRIAEAGLQDRVTLLLTDYREMAGQYDKLVSVEMIEAVGHEFLPTYFSACDKLLKPGGRMLVQAITMPDQRYTSYLQTVDFIQKYIFPGGCLPSIGAMQAAVGKGTGLRLTELFEFPESYALTLQHWRERFFHRLDEVRSLGFDQQFIRMWDYYLCYCEGAFRELVWDKVRF